MKMRITGVHDVRRVLEAVGPREAQNLMRSTVQGIAGELRKDARKNAPMDDGVLRRSIKARRRKQQGSRIISAVYVERPAFYWRFLEYGDGPDGEEHAFFLRALQKMRTRIDSVYLEIFVKKLQARIKRLTK